MYRNKYTLWYKAGHGGEKSFGDGQRKNNYNGGGEKRKYKNNS